VVKWRNSENVKAIGLINTSESIGKERLVENLYVLFLKQCDRIIFGCEDQRRVWVEKHKLSRDRSQVIYNGVDSTFYSPDCVVEESELLRRKLGIPDDAKIIGSVGRFRTEKSFDHLIMALAKLNRTGRESYGLLVGQGEEEQRLRQLAIEEGVGDKVIFLGIQRDVRAALSIMDVFVLPSSAVETFSNAALEAMAMARPVVLSDIGGAAEMIERGTSGMLFPVGNIDALVTILISLHDSTEARQALGSAARERVVQLYGFSDFVDQYKGLVPI
jgi:glycosyltransferase involved in cell wall biosynthesis